MKTYVGDWTEHSSSNFGGPGGRRADLPATPDLPINLFRHCPRPRRELVGFVTGESPAHVERPPDTASKTTVVLTYVDWFGVRGWSSGPGVAREVRRRGDPPGNPRSGLLDLWEEGVDHVT